MSQPTNKFCKNVRKKLGIIAHKQSQVISESFESATKKESADEKLKEELRPFVEKELSSATNSQDESELKKFVLSAYFSSDSGDENIKFTKSQLTIIIDQLVTEIKNAQKVGDNETSVQETIEKTENKYLSYFKTFCDIAQKTAVSVSVSFVFSKMLTYIVSSPDELPTIVSTCILPLVKTSANVGATTAIKKGWSAIKDFIRQ